jgi:galactose-1-phosphate uridylyltransferase
MLAQQKVVMVFLSVQQPKANELTQLHHCLWFCSHRAAACLGLEAFAHVMCLLLRPEHAAQLR